MQIIIMFLFVAIPTILAINIISFVFGLFVAKKDDET